MPLFLPLLYIAYLIISVVIHEYSHGKVADRLGDPTAKIAGRLTLNPIPHIDPIGSIILPLLLIFSQAGILFGWAKPVPVDFYNLRNPRKDAALISLAGPGANLLLALVCAVLLNLFIFFKLSFLATIGSLLLIPLIQINVILGIFNLLPIPPLDGFKIVGGIIPEDKSREWYQLERYGLIFIILLIIPFGQSSMLSLILGPVVNFILNLLLPFRGAGII